jgi:hypothetical protein
MVGLDEFRQRLKQDLEAMSRDSRTAFAAITAERRMRVHEALPPETQSPYVLSWRPTLDAVWRGLEGDPDAFSQVSKAVAGFYLSPQWHADGQDGPQDADNGAVSAAYYASMELMHGGIDFAVWAASAAVDEVYFIAEDQMGAGTRPDAWESEMVQEEIARQFADASYLRDKHPRWSSPDDARNAIEELRAAS